MTSLTSPSVRRVLVVFKTSPWELYADQGLLDELPDRSADGADILARLRSAHEAHRQTVEVVGAALRRARARGLEVLVRNRPTKRETAAADLVVTVGGDGTFLVSAQRVETTPMLGVNSAPSWSVGNYCGASAEDFEAQLEAIRAGQAYATPLARIAIRVGQRTLPHKALNDALICHRTPAASSRYLLRVDGHTEWQTSSGIWVSTPSGSTGAIRSAGGDAVPWEDTRLQYLVREAYAGVREPYRLLTGFLTEPIEIVPRSPHLAVYLDGHHSAYQIGLGVRVTVVRADAPLLVYGFDAA